MPIGLGTLHGNMASTTRVSTDAIVRELAQKLRVTPEQASHYLQAVCETLRGFLQQGHEVELGDLLSLAVSGGPELREDESGGFSAYAPAHRGIAATPIGALKSDLDRSCRSSIYYVSRGEGHFTALLSEHFGRRGWQLIQTKNGMEVQTRAERNPPVAIIFESHVEGWRELLRELKCDPKTNWVPVVGIFPSSEADAPAHGLSVRPDEVIHEPFDFAAFIKTAASGLAERVGAPRRDILEIETHLSGSQKDRREARAMVEEVLFRCGLPEKFNRDVGASLGEALDNAYLHGHRSVECCAIETRLLLDPKRVVLSVRDSGKGFDTAAALAAARTRRASRKSGESKDPLAKAAAALKSRRGDAKDGGIARMLQLMDRVDYNRQGTELVLTKNRPALPR